MNDRLEHIISESLGCTRQFSIQASRSSEANPCDNIGHTTFIKEVQIDNV